jgi:hypothetical protein
MECHTKIGGDIPIWLGERIFGSMTGLCLLPRKGSRPNQPSVRIFETTILFGVLCDHIHPDNLHRQLTQFGSVE